MFEFFSISPLGVSERVKRHIVDQDDLPNLVLSPLAENPSNNIVVTVSPDDEVVEWWDMGEARRFTSRCSRRTTGEVFALG